MKQPLIIFKSGTIKREQNTIFFIEYEGRKHEAKKIRKRKPKDISPVPERFDASPLESWWKLTDSMARRIVEYGAKDEVLEKAKKLCQKNFADECPEWEEVKRLIEKYNRRREVLKKLIGEERTPKVRLIDGRIADVKKGPGMGKE